jgi:hypothetical protein
LDKKIQKFGFYELLEDTDLYDMNHTQTHIMYSAVEVGAITVVNG